jgi:hypothetical protein
MLSACSSVYVEMGLPHLGLLYRPTFIQPHVVTLATLVLLTVYNSNVQALVFTKDFAYDPVHSNPNILRSLAELGLLSEVPLTSPHGLAGQNLGALSYDIKCQPCVP